MSWNKEAAVSYLRSHALGHSHSECAKFTRLAILAGVLRYLTLLMQKIMGRNYCVLDSVSCRPVQR
jgi:hypothetical protein